VTCSTPSSPECIGDTVAACPCSGRRHPDSESRCDRQWLRQLVLPGRRELTPRASRGQRRRHARADLHEHAGSGLFFQSNALGGPFVNFNDGILCAAVGIIRMGVVFPTAGVASYPGGLTPNPIHIAGAPVSLSRRRRSTTSAGTATSRRASAIRGAQHVERLRLFGRLDARAAANSPRPAVEGSVSRC
jgi:hypothetical protein